jgi:hypothetical protein
MNQGRFQTFKPAVRNAMLQLLGVYGTPQSDDEATWREHFNEFQSGEDVQNCARQIITEEDADDDAAAAALEIGCKLGFAHNLCTMVLAANSELLRSDDCAIKECEKGFKMAENAIESMKNGVASARHSKRLHAPPS